ncbi:MAG TPA: twin-arginine translocation signal domain-containing protein, partial [Vicinamibacteria bacterium]|nr:twin-arginine translocation signal domain-containing protein [Vicinamibacteria bacterium]
MRDSYLRPSDLTRRAFLTTAGASAAAAALAGCAPASQPAAQGGAAGAVAAAPRTGAVPVTLRINGQEQRVSVDPRTTLLDCLRETVGLTGTKKGCD